MKPYILLTPGPLTTSRNRKEAILTDWCTWDADYNVHIVEEIHQIPRCTRYKANR